ncbi:MAG: hypothetical protein K2W82_14130 [Candidatus Obscuribacterales bacterium]|nr:hypothetical protein [Candidatus Obscuribacterales bacterium]
MTPKHWERLFVAVVGVAAIVVLVFALQSANEPYRYGTVRGTIKSVSAPIVISGESAPTAIAIVIGSPGKTDGYTLSVRNQTLFPSVQALKPGTVISGQVRENKETRELELLTLEVQGYIELTEKK